MYYGFAVKAITAISMSDLSNQETLMAAMVPEQPVSLQVTSQDETQITLNWEEAANNGGSPVTGFKLYWSLDNYTVPIKTLNSETLTVGTNTMDGIVTGDLYSFKIIATNAIGDSLGDLTLENVVAA